MRTSIGRTILFSFAIAQVGRADDWCAESTPWYTNATDGWGSTFDLSLQFAAIGDITANSRVLIYSRMGDRLSGPAILYSPVSSQNNEFGKSISFSENTVLISEMAPIPRVFEFNYSESGWSIVGEIQSTDLPQYWSASRFGQSIKLVGNVAIVGAPAFSFPNRNYCGVVYVFERDLSEWTQLVRLAANDASPAAELGDSIAFDGEFIIATAPGDSDQTGAVYVFRNLTGGWTQAQKLSALDAGVWDRFGHSIALHEDRLVVGAPFALIDGVATGAAYVFERSGDQWIQTARLLPSRQSDWEAFGHSVAIAGSDILVGATEVDGAFGVPEATGRVYQFSQSGGTWIETQVLPMPSPDRNARIGAALCADASLALVRRENDEQYAPGHPLFVTVLVRNGADANGNGISDVCECIGDLSGDRSVGLNDLATLLANFGLASGATPEQGDIDADGDVDLGDLSQLLAAFGNECA